jgi:phosphoribosyl 1,2-cyclic phosphodiesterase
MHEISVAVLSSGSIGNSILVSGSGSNVLVDAGISCRDLERRLSSFGVQPTQIEAVVLTHEHTDHVRGARRFCTQYRVPVLGTRGTLALVTLNGLETRNITPKEPFSVGRLGFTPFKVRHLAADPIALTVSSGTAKVGIASDLGSVTPLVTKHMTDCGLMLVEANYDDDMLTAGNYPDFLKKAIRSDHGHLSNRDAAILSSKAADDRTKKLVLIHLSRENNTPEKARLAVETSLEARGVKPSVEVSEHGCSSGPHRLS